jgi:alanine racemase
VGAELAELARVVRAVADSKVLGLGALWTHLAVADGTGDEDRAFTTEQLRLFANSSKEVAATTGTVPALHAANSAAAITRPDARFSMVRCGIAVVGSLPSPDLAPALREAAASVARPAGEDLLRPVMSLRAEVRHLTRLEAGERPSYGRLRPLPERSTVATVPVGYADGVPRRFFDQGGTVLVGGRHRPLAGAVTMDQIMVDCGPDSDVSLGDEVVLIGEQGGERITAWDWAEALGTISYEIVSRIGPRVERVLVGDTSVERAW